MCDMKWGDNLIKPTNTCLCIPLADSWPDVFEDVNARNDWGHDHHYDLPRLTEFMLSNFKQQIEKQSVAV